ncbi:MAG: excinuclease ABC subunit UvrC [Candidatus Symbiobacter sp.]|nr:excinuclease ABC subunit UvrC [Candidatus Symbiobacter sp.]
MADAKITPSSMGAAMIEEKLANLPNGPGVYRMFAADGSLLYVGKAKSLKKRVAQYRAGPRLGPRIERMVALAADLEIVTTTTEAEALLLEANLIKSLKPRYNIILRDDKSFPYILLTGDHAYPQAIKHRGSRKAKGDYFGPFASGLAVNNALIALQRAFLLRNCSDTVFAQRHRPCLQYQIKRCAAPCVGLISETDYADLVAAARQFLAGKSVQIQSQLAAEMDAAAARWEFEQAARLRDRIRALTSLQARQDINVGSVKDADVMALYDQSGVMAIQVFFFRNGSNYGSRSYFPSHDATATPDAVMAAFIGQFYADKVPPPLILLSHMPEESELLAAALGLRAQWAESLSDADHAAAAQAKPRKIALVVPQRGARKKIIDHALQNAREAHLRRQSERASQLDILVKLAELFDLPQPPERIEVYDNSHTGGQNAVGAMIVAGRDGFIRNAYRKFNFTPEQANHGDDFTMMRLMLTRRFRRLVSRPDAARPDAARPDNGLAETEALPDAPPLPDADASYPDLLLIDGGAGQLSVAQAVLAELGLSHIPLVAIAKGPDRHAGRERFFRPGRDAFTLPPADKTLFYLQRLRDEAHRFVIGSHRARRSKSTLHSSLEDIEGIGAARRRALLRHFGSRQAIQAASIDDLCQAPAINRKLAEIIFAFFHPSETGDAG